MLYRYAVRSAYVIIPFTLPASLTSAQKRSRHYVEDPAIARFMGVRIGLDSTEELERRLGKAVRLTGANP